VSNITFAAAPPGQVSVRGRTSLHSVIESCDSGPKQRVSMPALRQLHPRLRSGRKVKAMRVTAISTDLLVPCPTCGGFMRLSDAQAFECKQCGRAIRVEGVLNTMDAGE